MISAEFRLSRLGPPRGGRAGNLPRYVDLQRRVVLAGDTPLAMTGFNAQIAGMVYTLHDQRGRRYAGRVSVLHLAPSGAYRAFGFRRTGDWTLMVLRDKKRMG